jgi:hypothetical protein
MKKLLLLLSLLPVAASAATPVVAPVHIVRAEFGLFETPANAGEVAFVPSSVVPLRVGQRYGWVIEVGKAPRTLSVREEYVSPMNSATTGDDVTESLSIPLARRSLVSQRQLVPVDGRIVGEWSVGAREPAGHRRLEVLVEGRVAASFEFDVE